MDEKLYDYLLKLPRANLVHTMIEALDLMQQHNGRTRSFCILTAIGAKHKTHAGGNWILPTITDAKKNTEQCPL